MRTRSKLSRGVFATLALALIAIAGCGSTTPIKTLLDDPGSYDGKTVRVSGTVTEAVGAMGLGAYRINDGTDTILVLAKTTGAPREGAKIGVEGVFRAAFTVGPETGAVIIEEKRATP